MEGLILKNILNLGIGLSDGPFQKILYIVDHFNFLQ